MTSIQYLIKRGARSVVLLWIIMTFLFLLFEAMPGSMVDVLAPMGVSEAYIERFEARWGLNDPLHERYFTYLYNYLTLDFGTSMHYNSPVWDVVNRRLLNSLILIIPAVTSSYLFGATVGTVMGLKRGQFFERYGMIPIILIGSIPGFFLGILLILIFSHGLGVLPTSNMASSQTVQALQDAPWWKLYLTTDFLRHFVLPAATVTLHFMYIPMLLMRINVVEMKSQAFYEYYKITGMPKFQRSFHIAKHSSLPVLTLFPIALAQAIGGLVIIEVVFNWPGVGFELFQAVLRRDLAVIRFLFILIALIIIVGNFLVDILYTVIDPRIDVEK